MPMFNKNRRITDYPATFTAAADEMLLWFKQIDRQKHAPMRISIGGAWDEESAIDPKDQARIEKNRWGAFMWTIRRTPGNKYAQLAKSASIRIEVVEVAPGRFQLFATVKCTDVSYLLAQSDQKRIDKLSR